jgi:uncharacterized protein YjbI with pentapeptide repeats
MQKSALSALALAAAMTFTSSAIVSCGGSPGEGADWRNQEIKTSFRNKGIDGFDFSKSIAPNADFQASSGVGPKFVGADLKGARFNNAMLETPDFEDANLEGAILSSADMRGANFAGANLDGAQIYRATLLNSESALKSTNFEGASL